MHTNMGLTSLDNQKLCFSHERAAPGEAVWDKYALPHLWACSTLFYSAKKADSLLVLPDSLQQTGTPSSQSMDRYSGPVSAATSPFLIDVIWAGILSSLHNPTTRSGTSFPGQSSPQHQLFCFYPRNLSHLRMCWQMQEQRAHPPNKGHPMWVKVMCTHPGDGAQGRDVLQAGGSELVMFLSGGRCLPVRSCIWSSHSSVCLATEGKVGMATLFQHVKGML